MAFKIIFALCMAAIFTTLAAFAEEEFLTEDDNIDFEQNIQKRGSDKFVINGVDLLKLNHKNLQKYLEAQDEIFFGKLDIESGKQIIKANKREKRALPVIAAVGGRAAFVAGRYIFRRIVVKQISRNGLRLTKQYWRKGGYRNGYHKALRDFRRFRPSNVKHFRRSNGMRGYTGRVGKYNVTVRNRSSGGKPTLEFFRNGANKSGRNWTMRKIRY